MVFSFRGAKGGLDKTEARYAGLAEVRAYWEGQRRNASIPTRAQLDPRGMAGALESVFVAERIGNGLVRLRIAGAGLAELAGMDMKGLPLSVLLTPDCRLRLAALLERVFTQPIAAELHLEGERAIGRPALDARLLLLPLRSANGVRDLVLGCLMTDGAIGRAPRRFAITRTMEEPLIAHAADLDDALAAGPRKTTFVPAFVDIPAEAPPPAPQRPIAAKPNLRLVHSAG